jgi:hypothetical protein
MSKLELFNTLAAKSRSAERSPAPLTVTGWEHTLKPTLMYDVRINIARLA